MIDTRFAIITGLSGGGKSTALRMLEDSGFLAMDNFPIALFSTFVQMLEYSKTLVPKIALVIDIRSGEIEEFTNLVRFLNEKKLHKKIVYLEAQDETMISRFKETRRTHPLTIGKNISLSQAIAKEKTIMDKMKPLADTIIDTSHLTPQLFNELLRKEFLKEETGKKIILMLISFGFKYGMPIESDIVVDVRFLPNPFFIKELKNTTGKDEKTYEFIINKKETQIFLKKSEELLSFLLPLYEKEGKSYFTLSYGCTGGKHRSVAIVEYMSKFLQKKGFIVNTLHRDTEKT
ncbi:MAG: RNase adapter RapZ [Campylobacterota bacterium]|nr:RNase adapter RapZ [Campylobacterota bacterium]